MTIGSGPSWRGIILDCRAGIPPIIPPKKMLGLCMFARIALDTASERHSPWNLVNFPNRTCSARDQTVSAETPTHTAVPSNYRDAIGVATLYRPWLVTDSSQTTSGFTDLRPMRDAWTMRARRACERRPALRLSGIPAY